MQNSQNEMPSSSSRKLRFSIFTCLVLLAVVSCLLAVFHETIADRIDWVWEVDRDSVQEISTDDELERVLNGHDRVIFNLRYDFSPISTNLASSIRNSNRLRNSSVTSRFKLVEIDMTRDEEECRKIYERFLKLRSRSGRLPRIDLLHNCDGLIFWKYGDDLYYFRPVFSDIDVIEKTQELFGELE